MMVTITTGVVTIMVATITIAIRISTSPITHRRRSLHVVIGGDYDHNPPRVTNVTRAHRTSPRAGFHGGRRKAHNRSAIPGPAIRPALHGEVSCGAAHRG